MKLYGYLLLALCVIFSGCQDFSKTSTKKHLTILEIKNITEDKFEAEILQAEKLVVIDVWADWCVPCQKLAPILEEIAIEKKNIKFVKMNYDLCPTIVKSYKIQSIPTLLIFKDGKLIGTVVGLRTKDYLLKEFQKHL